MIEEPTEPEYDEYDQYIVPLHDCAHYTPQPCKPDKDGVHSPNPNCPDGCSLVCVDSEFQYCSLCGP